MIYLLLSGGKDGDKYDRAIDLITRAMSKSPRAVAAAVNRTLEGIRTSAVRETNRKYFASAKDIRDTITLKRASAGNLMGEMNARGYRHSLADYKLTPNAPKFGKKTQLKGAVKREGGLKSLGDAFLVKRAGGKWVPFTRIHSGAGMGKYGGIRALISPGYPQIIGNKGTNELLSNQAEQLFLQRLEHELRRAGALP